MNKTTFIIKTLIFFTLFLFTTIFCISYGTVKIDEKVTIKILLKKVNIDVYKSLKVKEFQENIITKLRLKRVFLSFFIGAILSISGVVLQSLLKNPLAEPYILGISSGAGVGTAFSIFFKLTSIYSMYFFSFTGSISTIFLVYFISYYNKKINIPVLILAGVILNTFFSSVLSLIMYLSNGEDLKYIMNWLMGNISGINNSVLSFDYYIFSISLILLFTIYYNSKNYNLLMLGYETAETMGINIERLKKTTFFITAILVSFCVSLVGIIGFVGLIVPHMTRMLFGNNHLVVIPMSGVIGAIFLAYSDLISRVMFSFEIPIGIVTSFFGAPFFIFLLIKNRKKIGF